MKLMSQVQLAKSKHGMPGKMGLHPCKTDTLFSTEVLSPTRSAPATSSASGYAAAYLIDLFVRVCRTSGRHNSAKRNKSCDVELHTAMDRCAITGKVVPPHPCHAVRVRCLWS